MAPAPSAKTERLMNLVMTLLSTRRPLTRHELRRTVEQYRLAPSDDAFERMFERDKDELRALGVPLQTVDADPFFGDEVGYRIRADEYVLPEIEFEADELVVLGLAARTWSHGTLGGAAAQALRKLQATQSEHRQSAEAWVEPRLGTSEPTFPDILRAVQELREIRFAYRRPGSEEASARRVQPWHLTFVRGHWYLTGLDLDRDDRRVFRLSRIVGQVTRHGTPGAYAVPEDSRGTEIEVDPGPADPTPVIELDVERGAGAGLRRSATVLAEGTDWDRVVVAGMDRDHAVAEIAALLEQARGVTPRAVRDRVVSHLGAVLAAHRRADLDQLREAVDRVLADGRAVAPRRHGSTEPATERLARLLSMVPWLVHRQGIDMAEAARGLGVEEDQLRADLDLLFLCGTGSMPDELIEVDADGGRIFIRNAETISRPLRLGWDEAVTLIVGLRALAAVPGLHDDDAVQRALAKLERASGDLAASADRVRARLAEDVDPRLLSTLRGALSDRRRVRIVYESAGTDSVSERDVDIMRVASADGRWYIEGWCHRAVATRLFRLDRIRSATVLEVDGTPPEEASARDLNAGTYLPAPDALVATVLLSPSARWVSDYYPVEEQAVVTSAAGETFDAVTLRVSRPEWLIRLAVRLGGDCLVLAPEALRMRMLERVMASRDQHAATA
ncbi:WYL domain-containing protein [Nostocoides sp. F2B08]|uniref:helix-turn-helix transcriptional regulator n=1 Tax=Nostocoides sp. F2B08 TaxID=2653936 RepID=UPI001263D35D|nr:WYL domain-containing protein [Tetrasphaera sp. F2B08]KAB7742976.1 WYL domain-containing protein [Tetrasphaera sp. F2B08]